MQPDWINDSNDDGYPDDVTIRIALDPHTALNHPFLAALLDVAARIGVETHALPLPLVVASDANPQAFRARTPDDLRALLPDLPAETLAIAPTGMRAETCLTRLFTSDGALEDRDDDQLPDATRLTFDLPDALPSSLAAALANLAARLGLESGGVTLPITRASATSLRVRPNSGPAMLCTDGAGWRAAGEPAELARLLEAVALRWPHISAPETGGASAAVEWLRRALAGHGPEPPAPGDTLWELQWSARWEVDDLLETFRRDVLPALTPGTPATLTVFASEPPAIRARVQATLASQLRAAGHPDVEVIVLRAFKAGLAWLQEVVLPACRPLPIHQLQLGYRRHAAADDALDLPIRWLQELFPGPELLADALGLPLDAIDVAETTDGPTWSASALDAQGAVLGAWSCSPITRTQPFIAMFPDAETVTVTSGGIVLEQADATHAWRVASDLERFWSFWQAEALPRVRAEIDARGGAWVNRQPFFGALEVEAWLSEPNEPLGVREENDSAAEALHEDMYFTTLDAIELLGRRTTGERCNAPGAIVPIVRVQPGVAPHARVRLRRAPARRELPAPEARVTGLRLREDEFALDIDLTIDGPTEPTLARLRELAGHERGCGSLPASVTLAGTTVELRLPIPELLDPRAGGAPPMDINICGDDVASHARTLSAYPEVTAWIEDTSYAGRPLVALALGAPTPGRLRSAQKTAIFKPTMLIIARHHANEIASTNAAFQLAWLCVHAPHWRSLLDRVNVALLPYENPDGAALHARLAMDPAARAWKHHPARYNALGFEYGEAHFDPDSPFGEARARTSLWRRAPADLVVDNHGVPSHEWVQPFAGFGSPPRFRVSYWIPQELIYGIALVIDDPCLPEQQASIDALRDAVSACVRDTDIGDWNRVYGASYRFWGQSRLPERFPGEFHDDMLWHIDHAPADPQGRGLDSRYPRTTPIVWVTEVNDETANGAHLERVARAHLLANHATLELLASAAPPLSRWRIDDGQGVVTWRVGRERPLTLARQAPPAAGTS